MSHEAVAARYAKALFDIAVESKSLSSTADEVQRFAETYGAHAELRTVLNNPLIDEASRARVLTELGEKLALSQDVIRTLKLLAKRSRMTVIQPFARELRRLSDEREGVVRASVTSARPLDPALSQRIEQTLASMTKKKVVLTQAVDETLIAGVVTRIGDTVIDGSLRSRLDVLRAQLLSE